MEPTPVESKVVPEPAPAVEVALPTYRTKVGEVTRRETPEEEEYMEEEEEEEEEVVDDEEWVSDEEPYVGSD